LERRIGEKITHERQHRFAGFAMSGDVDKKVICGGKQRHQE
jgi:hypothetical protein